LAVVLFQQLSGLLAQVDDLLARLADAESYWMTWLSAVAIENRASARNLVHYWAIRQYDLRELQAGLASFGLSSLGRSEAHVQATLDAVRSAITAMLDGERQPTAPAAVSIAQGGQILRQHTLELLGPSPAHRATRIMVTLPSEAATNPDLVHGFVRRGMNIARINCAHDDAAAWQAMARYVRRAAESAGTTCLVAMDLAGPKLRTGPLQPGPRVVKLHPRRDALGQVLEPARAWLTSGRAPSDPPQRGMPVIPVPERWLMDRRAGQVLRLHDARGSKRKLLLQAGGQKGGEQTGFVLTACRTTYLATGTVLAAEAGGESAEVGQLPTTEQSLALRSGDLLELTRDCSPAPVGGDGPHGSAARCRTSSTTPAPATRSTSTTGRSAGESFRPCTISSPCASSGPGWGRRTSRPARASICPTPICRYRRSPTATPRTFPPW
jgi:pyruvate kinase